MATFSVCNFNNGAPLANLSSYVPTGSDVGTWNQGTGSYPGTFSTDSTGCAYCSASSSNGALYTPSGTPASADYDIQADFVFVTRTGSVSIVSRTVSGSVFTGYT